MRWFVFFLGGSIALIAAVLAFVWALDGFGPLDIGGTGLIALVAGSLGATALGVGLMALVFHSDRSGKDDL